MRDTWAPARPDTSEPTTIHQVVGTAFHGHYPVLATEAYYKSILLSQSPVIGCNNSDSVPELHSEVLPFRRLSLCRLVTHQTTPENVSEEKYI
jgi:hypothetical protein